MPVSSTVPVDTTNLLLTTVTSSAESDVKTDITASVVKRTAELDEESSSNGDVLPAYKVLKLSDSVPSTVTSCLKPGMSTVAKVQFVSFVLV